MKKKKKETFVSLLLKEGFDNDLLKEEKLEKDNKDDDTTFNELNDRIRGLTDELSELLEPVNKEEKEEKIVIESNFPKIDKLGSVIPHIAK